METKTKKQNMPGGRIQKIAFITLIENLLCLYYLLQIPSDQKNQIFFGLSKERLIMAMFFVIVAIGLVAIITNAFNLSSKLYYFYFKRKKISDLFFFLSTIIWGLFLLFPDYRFNQFAAVSLRLLPFFLFFFLLSATCFLSSRSNNGGKKIRNAIKNGIIIPPASFYFLLIGLFITILFIFVSGWGITDIKRGWQANGIPLEPIQIILFCLAIAGLIQINKSRPFFKGFLKNRIFLFFLIWALSACIWSFVPLKPHFFSPGPYAPNFEYYPYSDATYNDYVAQSAVNGFGFNWGRMVIKPIVTYIIFLCDILSGNHVNQAMLIQSALYAILPAILFLHGYELNGYAGGFLAAGFSIMHEWNALNTRHVLTIHSRLYMSEFLSEIILSALTLCLLKWFKKGTYQNLFAATAGGILAIGLYTRYNFYGFIPAIIFFAVLIYRNNKGGFFKSILIFLLSMFISCSPLIARSYQFSHEFIPEISGTIKTVIIGQRLKPIMDKADEIKENEKNLLESKVISKSNPIPSESEATNKLETLNHEIIATDQPSIEVNKTIVEEVDKQSAQISISASDKTETAPIMEVFQEKIPSVKIKIHPLVDLFGNYTLRNLIASFHILPLSIRFDDLEHLYTNSNSIWADEWDYKYTFSQWIIMLFYLLIIVIGISNSLSKNGGSSLILPFSSIAYAFSLAISSASGGRYIVPMNGLTLTMFASGIASTGNLLLNSTIPSSAKRAFNMPRLNENKPTQNLSTSIINEDKSSNPIWIIPIVALFFSFFFSMMIFEKSMPKQYSQKNPEEIILEFKNAFDENINWDQVLLDVYAGKMAMTNGKGIYPRFYYYNTGEHGNNIPYMKRNYSRLVFTTLDTSVFREMVMPITDIPELFPHDSNISVLFCNEDHYADVLGIVGTTPEGETFSYLREPMKEFRCPISEPVCAETNKCQ